MAMNALYGNIENFTTSPVNNWEDISLSTYGSVTFLEEADCQSIIDNFDQFKNRRLHQVDALWGETALFETINKLVLEDSTIDSNNTDLGMTIFMATEESSVEILKNTLRLLDYINAYNPIYPATKESVMLLATFEESRELLKRKIIQVIRMFGSPGSIFYIPEEYSKQIIKSMHERIRLFENTGEILTPETAIDLFLQKKKLKNEIIRFGKEKRKISMNHIQRLVLELIITPLRKKFDEMKGELRDSIRVNKRVSNPVEKIAVNDAIIEKEPKKSIETALQKVLKIQARITSIGIKGVRISEGEKSKILTQISTLEKKYPEISAIINDTKQLLSETLKTTAQAQIQKRIPTPQAKPLSASSSSEEVSIDPEAIEISKLLTSQIRALKGEIGNPSSTCTTNKGSYGDGQFWYNYLLPLLNALELILQEDPNFALNFSWKKLAEHEKIVALYSGQRFRHWHAILLKDQNSEDALTEWSKLPSLVSKQIGSGGFNKRNGQPLVILISGLESFFIKNTEKYT